MVILTVGFFEKPTYFTSVLKHLSTLLTGLMYVGYSKLQNALINTSENTKGKKLRHYWLLPIEPTQKSF